MKKIKSLGNFEKIIETLKKRLLEQKKDIKEGINGLEHLVRHLLGLMDLILKE